MKINNGFKLLILLSGFTISTSLKASDPTYYDLQGFSKPLASACNERWKRNGKGDPGPQPPQVCDANSSRVQTSASQGGWRLNLYTLCNIESSWYATGGSRPMMSYKSPAVVENYGDHMTFAFLSQAVLDEEVELVEKEIQDRREEMAKEYNDTQVQLTRINGAYALTAQTDFSKGMDNDDIEDRIVWLTGQAQFLLCDITNGQELTRMAVWDRLKGARLTHLSKSEFYTLNPTLHEGYGEKDGPGKEGTWSVSMGKGKYTIWVENHGDKMALFVGVPYDEIPSGEAAVEKLIADLEKWAAKNRYEDAAEMTVEHDEDNEKFWIGAHFPYSSGLTGKKVMNLVKDFEQEYGEECADDVTEIIEDSL